jgi:uncharacterized membrane protein YfcA
MDFPEPALWLLFYLAIGAFVGTFAGMLGIGGGMIIIPLLAMAFEGQGVPREQLLHLAVGTAMATIAFTSLSSMRAHANRKAVRWEIAWRMTPGILLGSLVGAQVAKLMSTRVLAIYFAVFVCVMALNMALDWKPTVARVQLGRPGMFAAGFVISGLSALIAMGGAALTVPLMLFMEVPMIQAIGTAAAIGFPIAVGGTAGYLATGWGNGMLPSWSVGYVYLPALIGITAASVLMAPVGARIAHRLPARTLKLIFATLLTVLAVRMLVSLW